MPKATQTVPECEDCPAAVDVGIKTPSGELFGAHSLNLDLYSDGFPPASFADGSTVNMVELSENEEVVQLMLKYMHKQRQPNIRTLEFRVLKGLADAAEKYFIYSAMDICNLQMQSFAKVHPLDVLSYAAKHSYPDISDVCAPATLGMSLKKVQASLGPIDTLRWATYRENFFDILRTSTANPPPVVQHKGGSTSCDLWKEVEIQSRVIKRVLADPECLLSSTWRTEMIRLFDACPHCTIRVTNWIDGMKRSASALPVFSKVT